MNAAVESTDISKHKEKNDCSDLTPSADNVSHVESGNVEVSGEDEKTSPDLKSDSYTVFGIFHGLRKRSSSKVDEKNQIGEYNKGSGNDNLEKSVSLEGKSDSGSALDEISIERNNLLCVLRLSVRHLIEASMAVARNICHDIRPLQDFMNVLEHIFMHRIKARRGLSKLRGRDVWIVMESLVSVCPELESSVMSVQDMSGVKQPLGKLRAWLKLALMEKRLDDYFRAIVERGGIILADSYEVDSVLRSEEAVIISGHLVGLKVLDCQLCVREDDMLDAPIRPIDYSVYLRQQLDKDAQTSVAGIGQDSISEILDQKNYLEELNRSMQNSVSASQSKAERYADEARDLREELKRVNGSLAKAEESVCVLRKRREVEADDVNLERETFITSRAGVDQLYADAERKLFEETRLRQDVEKELETQVSMKLEVEMALQLVERDLHEKHDTITSLRRQLEDIKAANIQLFGRLQDCEKALQHKRELVTALENKKTELHVALHDSEESCEKTKVEQRTLSSMVTELQKHLAEVGARRGDLETDLRVEREWRAGMLQQLEELKTLNTSLKADVEQSAEVEQEYEGLQDKYNQLEALCREQEQTLAELGGHLSESKLKMVSMRERDLAMKAATWADDASVRECRACEKPFSVARRKHHCRNCGEIFCNECSENRLPLPASSKPVRVCEACHSLLLQRFAMSD